jgi:hypothetical protein
MDSKQTAWRRFADADCAGARDAITTALDEDAGDPDALDGLGQSLWWPTARPTPGRAAAAPAGAVREEFRREGEFIRPPRIIQRVLFSALAPLAWARGYKAINPEYLGPTGKAAARQVVEESRAS